MTAPSIVTPRLALRAHRPDDFAACAAMWADPRVARPAIGEPSSATATWRRMLVYAGLWSLVGYGYWAIEELATRAYAGDVGVANFHRASGPVPAGEPEMGWALVPDLLGRGYALEAGRAVLAWTDAHLAAPRVVCGIDRSNGRSLHLAAKLGFAALPPSAGVAAGPLVALGRPRGAAAGDRDAHPRSER